MHNRRPEAVAPRLSIVIPTYNRRDRVGGAIDSALAWLDALGEGEIVLIDDASTDGTNEAVAAAYAERIAAGQLSLHRLPENAGVTAAKNEGAARARGEWLVFLDSDDRLVAAAAAPALAAMAGAPEDAPLIFFRCVDESGTRLLGRREQAPRRLDLSAHIGRWQWGECLPALRAGAWRLFPYEADLRGYEAIAFGRMIRAQGDAVLSDIAARLYDESGTDRITGRASRRRHACLHARGNWLMLREFGGAMPLGVRYRYFRGAVTSALLCLWRRLSGRG